MSEHLNRRLLERLIPSLTALRDGALEVEREFEAELEEIEPAYRDSARNLLHYLSVRQHDIRHVQQDLIALGLSSLGTMEASTLVNLNAVLHNLHALTGSRPGEEPEPPVDFRTGPLLLRDHTRSLLGPEPANRTVRIMVTMPSAAATDPKLLQELVAAGMDVMRVNCAHDGPEAWITMVENLRQAERATGRRCRVQFDLAGPKLRTGPLAPAARVIKLKPKRDALGRVSRAARVWLTPAERPEPAPPGVRFVLPVQGGGLGAVQPGDVAVLSDARDKTRRLPVVDAQGDCRVAEADRAAYVQSGTELVFERGGSPLARGRVGGLPEVAAPITLLPGDRLLLTRAPEPGRDAVRDLDGAVEEPARIQCTLAAAFEQVRPGERVWIDDGKIGALVRGNDGEVIEVEVTLTGPQGARLRAEKGINFPDTRFDLPALTDKDREDLAVAVRYADMVALSFLRRPEDVIALEDELHRLSGGHLGIVLKIENRQAFENLPRILLASLRSPPVGVMVARGDLAVEVGFERLSEVQEEILWICEAAHVPVIWATQILEGMAKRGAPSRAEVTDAAASSRAECAMLNKGPNIVETVHFLSGVLGRMDEHLRKRRAMLRKLSIARLD